MSASSSAATRIAGQVTGLVSFSAGTPAKAAEVNGNFTAVQTAVGDNDARIAALETKLAKFGTTLSPAVSGGRAECTLGEILLFAGRVADGVPAQGQLMPICRDLHTAPERTFSCRPDPTTAR